MSYADVLESYLIPVEEGFMDKVKSAGRFIGKTLLLALAAIKKVLVKIVEKVRALLRGKRGNKEKPVDKNQMIQDLSSENAELKRKIASLETSVKNERYEREDAEHRAEFYSDQSKRYEKERDNNYYALRDAENEIRGAERRNLKLEERNKKLSEDKEKVEGKKERATKMIATMKKQLAENEEKMKSLKLSAGKQRLYASFQKNALAFISHVSQQINKAYMALPKLVAEAKKYEGKSSRDLLSENYRDSFYTGLERDLPTMKSGSWSYLYKTLKYKYLDEVKENAKYIEFEYDLARGFEIMVKQANQTIEYLEKMVKDIQGSSENNPAYRYIIGDITQEEGFLDMLRSSVNLANEILNCYEIHDEWYMHRSGQAI